MPGVWQRLWRLVRSHRPSDGLLATSIDTEVNADPHHDRAVHDRGAYGFFTAESALRKSGVFTTIRRPFRIVWSLGKGFLT